MSPLCTRCKKQRASVYFSGRGSTGVADVSRSVNSTRRGETGNVTPEPFSNGTGMTANGRENSNNLTSIANGRCLDCLSTYLDRLFRVSVGRCKLVKRPAYLAVGISGGACSAALAHLAYSYIQSLSLPPSVTPPPLLLLHVPVSNRSVLSVRAIAKSIGPGVELQVLSPVEDVPTDAGKDSADRARIRRMRVRNAVVQEAKVYGVQVVLEGACCARVAAEILCEVVEGRGSGAAEEAQEVGFVNGMAVVRPVRDARGRHLWRYAIQKMRGDLSIFDNGDHEGELRMAVKKFVACTGDENSASLHNVVKTAARLSVMDGEQACQSCQREVMQEGSNGICRPCAEMRRRAGGLDAWILNEERVFEDEHDYDAEDLRKRQLDSVKEFLIEGSDEDDNGPHETEEEDSKLKCVIAKQSSQDSEFSRRCRESCACVDTMDGDAT